MTVMIFILEKQSVECTIEKLKVARRGLDIPVFGILLQLH